MERLGYWVFVVLVFVRYSRIIEQYWYLHIPMMLLLFATAVAVAKGSIFRVFSHRLGHVFLAMSFFMLLSVPFSVWPGGSFGFLKDNWIRTMLVFFLTFAYATTFARVRTIIATIAASFVFVAVKSRFAGREIGGRSGAADYTFGNPNDMAMAMLLAIPLCLWIALDRKSSLMVRLGFLGTIPILVFAMSGTGSRMMVLCLGIMGLYLLYKVRGPARVALIAGGALTVGLAVATMPATSLARIMTLFSSSGASEIVAEGDRIAESASLSSSGRLHLLKQSVSLALDNPIFGVGIHMFSVAENSIAVEAGASRGRWQVAHNSYTEVAAECGLAAFVCYMYFLIGGWRTYSGFEKLKPDDHPEWKRLGVFGWTIKAFLVNYAVCSFFLSIGYDDLMPTIVGLGAATQLIVRRDQLLASRPTRPQPAAEPTPVYGYSPEAVDYTTQPAPQGD